MRNSYLSILLFVLVAFMVLFNVYDVQTKPAAPPSGGVSGDPGRSTCAFPGCHPGPEISFNPGEIDINMGLTQGNLSPLAGQTYIPGQVYFIEVKPNVTNGNNTKYGFQTTALTGANSMAGSFTITDATHNSAQVDPLGQGRNYIGHKSASSFHDWIFKWTAPATNVGDITFYYAVDDADGNGSDSGDKIYKGTTVITPDIGSGVSTFVSDINSVLLFPNPTKDELFLSFSSSISNTVSLKLFSLDGKLTQNEVETDVSQGNNVVKMNVADNVTPGVYIVELSDVHSSIQRRVIIQ